MKCGQSLKAINQCNTMTTGEFIAYELFCLLAVLGVLMYWDHYIRKEFEKKLVILADGNKELARKVIKLLREHRK